MLTSNVSLESLGQAEFNAPYDVVFRREGFSAVLVYVKNLQNATPITNVVQSSQHFAQMIFRPCLTKNIKQIFKFKTVWPRQPIKFDREAAKQEASQFLSSHLTDQNQTWYIDP